MIGTRSNKSAKLSNLVASLSTSCSDAVIYQVATSLSLTTFCQIVELKDDKTL